MYFLNDYIFQETPNDNEMETNYEKELETIEFLMMNAINNRVSASRHSVSVVNKSNI